MMMITDPVCAVGISERPEYKHWHNKDIPDDPNLHKGIMKNYLSFAGGGPNTRSTQLFIAFEDLDFLGKEPWETPFGMVTEGQATLDALYKGYGDIPPFGKGPDQQKIHNRGNQYLRENFPKVDYILSCEVVHSNIIQQTAFDPAAHHDQQQQQQQPLPVDSSKQEEPPNSRDAPVVAQTPFDPEAVNRMSQEGANNLRADSKKTTEFMNHRSKMVFLAVGGIGLAAGIAAHFKKRLVTLSKSN
jgi:cyclophilin family peptidyl-prolyl cis-trans isomerase